MKLFLAIVLLFSGLLTSARAQQDADSRYVTIYSIIEQADTYVSNGQSGDALAAYKDAQTQLLKFQQIYPDWETDIVSYRLSDLAGKIAALQAQMPAQTNAVAATAVAASAPTGGSAGISTSNAPAGNAPVVVNNLQMNVLQSQLQSLQDQNAKLQSKLQEALSAQPQMVEASALTQANDQIRALMKENDLLKASLHTRAQPTQPSQPSQPDAEVSQLRSQLDETTQKLADEHALAQKLADENATLQLTLANSSKQTADSSSSLRDENDRLKSQLDSMQAAALQSAANNSTTVGESAAQLAAAKAQIATLQSAVMLANLEKTALEDRLKRVNSEFSSEQRQATGRRSGRRRTTCASRTAGTGGTTRACHLTSAHRAAGACGTTHAGRRTTRAGRGADTCGATHARPSTGAHRTAGPGGTTCAGRATGPGGTTRTRDPTSAHRPTGTRRTAGARRRTTRAGRAADAGGTTRAGPATCTHRTAGIRGTTCARPTINTRGTTDAEYRSGSEAHHANVCQYRRSGGLGAATFYQSRIRSGRGGLPQNFGASTKTMAWSWPISRPLNCRRTSSPTRTRTSRPRSRKAPMTLTTWPRLAKSNFPRATTMRRSLPSARPPNWIRTIRKRKIISA